MEIVACYHCKYEMDKVCTLKCGENLNLRIYGDVGIILCDKFQIKNKNKE